LYPLKKLENTLLPDAENYTSKFVSMICKLNSPILKSFKLNLLLLIKKLFKKNLTKFAWPNPPINITDFTVPLNPFPMNLLITLKLEKLTPNKMLKKEEKSWLKPTEWKKVIPKKSGHLDLKIKDLIF
jgi:hypothetical protein